MMLAQLDTVSTLGANGVPPYGRWNCVTPKSPGILEFFPIVKPYGFEQTFEPILPSLFGVTTWALIHVVNTLTARSQSVMRLVRAFTLCCLSYNIIFQSCHVPGVNNKLADALSYQ